LKTFIFAARLEGQVRREVEALSARAPAEPQAVVGAVAGFQAEFELLVDRAQGADIDRGRFPPVDAGALLGPDNVWQEADGGRTAAAAGEAGLTALWLLYALMDRSGQFYQQAANNSAHPAARLFWGSLAEVKGMMRRRLDGVLRGFYNAAWTEVGYAPFVMGKD